MAFALPGGFVEHQSENSVTKLIALIVMNKVTQKLNKQPLRPVFNNRVTLTFLSSKPPDSPVALASSTPIKGPMILVALKAAAY